MGFGSPAAFAIDYFVSTSGNDANPGTAAQPWRSITRALNQALTPHATTGDNVNVAAGTYDSSTENFPLSLVDGVALKGAGSTQSFVVGAGSAPLFSTSATDLTPATVVNG